MSTTTHEEYRRAVAARNKLIMVRNLVCIVALVGGAGIGVLGMMENMSPKTADEPTAKGADLGHVEMINATPLPESKATSAWAIPNWKGKGASLHGTASSIAGYPMNLTRSSAGQVKVNREWDSPEVLDQLLPKPTLDPGVSDLRLDTLQEQPSATAIPRTLNDAERLLDSVPSSVQPQVRQTFERIRAGHGLLLRARETGGRLQRDQLLQQAKDEFRAAIEELTPLRDGPPRVEALSHLMQYARTCISDCNKSMRGG